jgi:hypothetical protein
MDSVTFLELLITVGVVTIQAWSYLRTRQRTRVLANLFPGSNPVARVISAAAGGTEVSEADRCPHIEPTGQVSAGFRAILDATNQYLQKNAGAPADFHILQGIAERISDSTEYEASANATLPLYIGLMGTFIGVIVGLVTIAQEPSSTIGDSDLKRFLGGVLVAMTGSLCGLLLTVIGRTICLQPARAQNDTRKQSYYILLESELLPAVGLDASAELHTLQGNLHQFNVDFRSNLGLFTDAMKIAVGTMKQQRELLDTLNKAKIAELIAANVELLTRVQGIAVVFSEFVGATAELQKRITLSTDVADKLNALLDRVHTFEQSINALGDKLSVDQSLAMRSVKLVEDQLEILKRRNQVVTQYADVQDEELKTYFSAQREKLTELTNKASQQLDELASEISRSVAEAFGTERTTQLVADVARLKEIDDHIRLVGSELREWRLSAPQQEVVRALQQFAQARQNGGWFTGWFKRRVVPNSPKRASDADAPEDSTS